MTKKTRKTTTPIAALATALTAAAKLAPKLTPKRASAPIRACARVTLSPRVTSTTVTVEATDYDIWTAETIHDLPYAPPVSGSHSVVVDARDAAAAAKTAATLNDARVAIETTADGARVLRIGPVLIPAPMDPADYLLAPQLKGEPVNLTLYDWPAACAAVRHCASTEETRYYLNGVLIRTRGDGAPADIVATDGHRLARYAIDARGPAMDIIVPNAALDLLADMTSCATDGDILHAHINGRSVVTKLIQATYPAYERVIPLKESNGKTVIASSVIRADAMADAATLACGLFSKGKDDRTVKWVGETLFVRDTALPCPGAAPPAALETGFDPLYLRDMARTFKDGFVDCYASDNGSPFLFERGSLQYVVMPKRI